MGYLPQSLRLVILSLAGLLVLVAGAAGTAATAHAQQKSPFGIPVPGAADPAAVEEPGTAPPPGAGTSITSGRGLTAARPPAGDAPGSDQAREHGPLTQAWVWLMRQQQAINRELSSAVRRLKTEDPWTSALFLGLLSFTYGVLHAAGPGHGKAVISSYVLANERTVRRGIMLSFMAAFIQAISAIVIVGVMAIVLNQTSMQIKATEAWITTMSWGLVAAIGAWLLYTQLRPIFSSGRSKAAVHDHHHAHDHGHHHHGHAHHSHGHNHGHDHRHHHGADGACASCGHAHIPDPSQLEGKWSWTKAVAVAFSVGIRPCTGAILVLIFALTQGLIWAGVFATFAMALGTAITVSALAALAVGSRELATRLAGGESIWATRLQTSVGVLASVFLLMLGVVFFIGSLNPTAPF